MFDSGMLILSLAIWFCRFFLKNFDNFQGPAFNPPEKFCRMTPQNFGRQKYYDETEKNIWIKLSL